jgi:hypothetical protein
VTIRKALTVLEAAVLEFKKRDIDTPAVREALEVLEAFVKPEWLIPQFRNHVAREDRSPVSLEGQQHVLRTTFPAIRESVRVLIGERMDKLARQFAATTI